jgi:KDO2-lipid IV(A) lauroyltransferase
MDFVTYLFFLFLVTIIGITPFFILYGFADFVYFVLYKLLGYRKPVVQSNLRKVFHDKSDKELKQIEKASYKNLADIFVEGVKGFTVSRKAVLKRHKLLNPQLLDKYYEKNQPVIILAGHAGNWEWGPLTLPHFIKHRVIGFYKPLANKYIDGYVIRSRAKAGSELASIYKTAFYFREYKNDPVAFVMIADQSPSNVNRAVWVNFLGIETAFLHGPELYAKKYNIPVIFLNLKRVRRGWYEYSIELMFENPADTKTGEITQAYARKMEEMVLNDPSSWLWSHKRWKHSRKK